MQAVAHPTRRRSASGHAACYSIVDMLLARLASLATRTARGRRALWRTWYQFLAARYREPGWTFMNYGYRDPGGAAGPALDPGRRGRPLVHPALRRRRARGAGRGARPAGGRLRPGRRGRLPGARALPRSDGRRRSLVARDRALSPALRAPQSDLPGGGRGTAAVRRRLVRRRDQRRVVALLRDVLEPSWPRSDACCAPAGGFCTPTFARAQRSRAGGRPSRAAGFVIEAERDLRPGVVAALDADDDRKRDLIGRLVDRPLAHIFREFAALRGSALYGLLRDGDLCLPGVRPRRQRVREFGGLRSA